MSHLGTVRRNYIGADLQCLNNYNGVFNKIQEIGRKENNPLPTKEDNWIICDMNIVITNEIKNIRLLMQYFYNYGFKLGGISLVDGLARRLHFNKLYIKTSIKRKEICQDYIKRNYSEIIEKYRNYQEIEDKKIGNDYTIWIFWWQGESNMPYPVDLCLNSVKRHMGEHQIVLVSKDNYSNYLDVPQYMLQKLEMGKISYAHFSDYVRVALLAQYGGMWIDSTFYMTDSFSVDFSGYSFFSINHGGEKSWVASNDLWSICLLACNKNYKLMLFLKELMEC